GRGRVWGKELVQGGRQLHVVLAVLGFDRQCEHRRQRRRERQGLFWPKAAKDRPGCDAFEPPKRGKLSGFRFRNSLRFSANVAMDAADARAVEGRAVAKNAAPDAAIRELARLDGLENLHQRLAIWL